MDVPGKWMDRAAQHRSLDKLILDLNSSVSQTYRRRDRAVGRQLQRLVRPPPYSLYGLHPPSCVA